MSLVLAITGLLLIGLITNTSGSVERQRYNDSVQNTYDFLRSLYSSATNPQGINDTGGNGRAGYDINTDRAIYGKAVYFGLSVNDDGSTPITSVTITGDADAVTAAASNPTLSTLKNSHLRTLSNSAQTFTPPWGATLETSDHKIFAGIMIVVRSPADGTIHTYFVNAKHQTDHISITNYTSITSDSITATSDDSLQENPAFGDASDGNDLLHKASVSSSVINFCVNSPDLSSAGNVRRNIRIVRDAHNATGVQLIDTDSEEDNKCR